MATKTSTLMPIRIGVASGLTRHEPIPWYTFCLPVDVHSGQWKPTEAWCMHDGQIGRSQRWQLMPATRSGWR